MDHLIQIIQSYRKRGLLLDTNLLLLLVVGQCDIRAVTTFKRTSTFYDEKYVASTRLAVTLPFIKFGLTDSSIIAEAKGNYLVLTDDLRLLSYLQSLLIDAINFNHLRIYNWSMPQQFT